MAANLFSCQEDWLVLEFLWLNDADNLMNFTTLFSSLVDSWRGLFNAKAQGDNKEGSSPPPMMVI